MRLVSSWVWSIWCLCAASVLTCYECAPLAMNIKPYSRPHLLLSEEHSTIKSALVDIETDSTGRRLLQTCDAGTYRFNSQCHPCPAESTSNPGSTGYTSCICNFPKYRIAYNIIYGRSDVFATDTTAYTPGRVFIIQNFILPQGSPLVGTVITSWTVTTVRACTIQPFITAPSNNMFFTNPASGTQLYYIYFMAAPVSIPGAGTFTFPWTAAATRGGNALDITNSMSLGWLDVSGSGNCVATSAGTTGRQLLGSWVPFSPVWADGYYGNFNNPGIWSNVSIQINSDPVGVPSVMSCNNCSANFYFVSNTQCNACPVNSISPEGSPNIDSCVCNRANMLMSEAKMCVCSQNFYMSGGTTCLACPGNLVSPIASSLLSNCTCNAPAVRFNSTWCVCGAGTFGNGRVCTSCTLGHLCPQGSTVSSLCPAGRFCASTVSSTVCSSGTLCLAGSTSERPCPAGSFCTTPSTQATCPADSYCPSGTVTPIACPTNYYSQPGSSLLSQCVLVCPVNTYCVGDQILQCPANSVSPFGSTSISQCTCTNPQLSIINNKCSCPRGRFLSNGNCLTCPPGMVCAVSFDPATCSPGSFCPEGSTEETPCQAGSFCATPSTQVQCPANTYCPASSTAPINCPLDHVSPAGSSLLSQCETQQIEVSFGVEGAGVNVNETEFKRALPGDVQLNSYEDMVVLTIGSCPRGYYCPPDTTTAIPCPPSTYNNDTHADTIEDCLTCPVGQYCPLASLLPTACPAGTYRGSEGAAHVSDCTVCPSGNFCPIKSVNPTNCSAGTFGQNPAAESRDSCQACPTGQFCPIATTTPIACAAGSFRATTGGTRQEDCDVCPVGQFCPLQTTTPTDCAAGSYRGSTGGAQQGDCTTCPSGNFCPIKSVDPTNCSVGTYNPSAGGTSAGSCLACPLGEFCPIATTTPIACAAGSYRGSTGAGNQADCTVCPSGNFCPIRSVTPTNCSAGTFNPSTGQTSAGSCLSCPAGEFCPAATTAPSQCAANTFSPTTGAAVCKQCPIFSTSPVASTNCTCNAGHFHVVVTVEGGAMTRSFRVEMAEKVYGGVADNSNPATSNGFLQSGGVSHISITKGSIVTFQSNPYSVSNEIVAMRVFSRLLNERAYAILKQDIDNSFLGLQYHDMIPISNSMTHASQTSLSYSIGVLGQGTNTVVWNTTEVPSNLYFIGPTSITGSRAALTVFVASATPTTITYSPVSSITTSIFMTAACLGDTLILNKPSGVAFYNTPNDIVVYCVNINDQSMTWPQESETVLASGPSPLTWTVSGIDNTMQCYIRYGLGTSGYYSYLVIYPRPAPIGPTTSALTCANCSSGFRSDPGAKVCTECGLGFFSGPVSQTCTACPVGTKCPNTTTPAPVNCGVGLYQSQPGQSVCLPCPAGQYCDLDATVTPKDCPAGTFRSTEGAASVNDCVVCTPGSYCPVKSVEPTSCAAGSFQNETGGQSQDDCDVCTVGNYCPVRSVTPTSCPAGTHRGSAGAQSVSDCATCTTGHFCPIQSVTPTQCVAGTYNPSTGGRSAQDCLACPVGQFCLVATTTPTSCAAGSYRGEPGAESQAQCTVCPTGNFCPIQSVNPTNCSAGSYNPSTGSGSSAACLSCPVGDFCPVASTNSSFCASGSYRGSEGATRQEDCTVCPSGNFCPVWSVSPVNCSAGTFRATTAGASVSDCTVCATGKYSLAIASSTDCPLCPSNYYCANSTTIKTCPTHTSSAAGSSSLLHCRCDPGFKCAYSKRITEVVTLNATTSTFNNNVGGIRTAFINAVADAAGVSTNQVTINSVVPKTNTGGRRLLSADGGFIDVFASVQGAERLHRLDFHLARHSATLHLGHSWQEAHSVTSTLVRRAPVLSTR